MAPPFVGKTSKNNKLNVYFSFVITLSHKSKQYLLVALKVFILGVTFRYIYLKLTASGTLNFKVFVDMLAVKNSNNYSILLFLVLTSANWFFEILKWKTIVSVLEPLSFKTALKQSLAALTVSLATPNRIGDYGAKAMYFTPKNRKQILLLNFFSNSVQMVVSCFFGSIGLAYVIQKNAISFSTTKILLFVLGILLLSLFGYIFRKKQLILKGLSLSKVMKYIRNLSGVIKTRILVYSIVRYFIFSFLFYSLLLFFGATIPFIEAIPLIFTMYLLVSIIPTIIIFDVVVRGGVAVWLFSMAGVPELHILSTVVAMWLLNFVVPAIWGSFYVVSYKPVSR